MYYAELNEDNIVIRVIAADEAFIKTLPGIWVETCMHGIKSKNYAGLNTQFCENEKEFKSCTLEQKFKIELAKNENGKQLYYKKVLGENKKQIELIPLKQKTFFLQCTKTGKKHPSKRKPEILFPEGLEE